METHHHVLRAAGDRRIDEVRIGVRQTIRIFADRGADFRTQPRITQECEVHLVDLEVAATGLHKRAHFLAVDGSFIKSVHSNDQAATIVRAVLGLGRGLRLPVLAEGVETHAELQFLQKELCDEAQGYFLGRPADIETFRHLTHREDVKGSTVTRLVAKGPRTD
jgi:predicted signal transduction protein with EAL and GGDEF domain